MTCKLSLVHLDKLLHLSVLSGFSSSDDVGNGAIILRVEEK